MALPVAVNFAVPSHRRAHLQALTVIKAVHTLAWFSIDSSVIYLLYSGLRRKSDHRAAIAGAIVAAESLIFAANGFRFPLTNLAVELGADRGGVTDTFLPRWFARNLPAIHAPLFVVAIFLHLRNIRADRRSANAKRPSLR